MRNPKFPRSIIGIGLVLAGIVACSDAGQSPLAPQDATTSKVPVALSASKGKTETKVTGLEWRSALKTDMSAGAVIGAEGGTFRLAATGLTIVVPPGAVSRPTSFGVTALAGKLVAYDFQPAGTTFTVPLTLVQDPRYVRLDKIPDVTAVPQGAYFPSTADLDQVNGTANVAETRPTTVSSAGVTFEVWHFSGYMVAWGRSSQ